jgi:hypothetical protein
MATCDATSIALLSDAATAYTAAATAANTTYTTQTAIVAAQTIIADNIGVCIASLRARNNPADANSIAILVAAQGAAQTLISNAAAAAAIALAARDNNTLNATQATAAAAALRPNATGATAGSPGTWTPSGTDVPTNLAQVIADAILPTPTTAWTNGQHVITADTTHVHWDGLAWVTGNSALATGATAGTPGSWTGGAEVPVNLAGTIAAGIIANPLTAWTTGQRVVTRDAGLIHWDSAAWVAGAAP